MIGAGGIFACRFFNQGKKSGACNYSRFRREPGFLAGCVRFSFVRLLSSSSLACSAVSVIGSATIRCRGKILTGAGDVFWHGSLQIR